MFIIFWQFFISGHRLHHPPAHVQDHILGHAGDVTGHDQDCVTHIQDLIIGHIQGHTGHFHIHVHIADTGQGVIQGEALNIGKKTDQGNY